MSPLDDLCPRLVRQLNMVPGVDDKAIQRNQILFYATEYDPTISFFPVGQR